MIEDVFSLVSTGSDGATFLILFVLYRLDTQVRENKIKINNMVTDIKNLQSKLHASHQR